MKKSLYLGIGSFFVALGMVGIFVPLLPTTPFLLIAIFCFERGSPRLHQWLLDHPRLGPPVRDWQLHKRIRPRYKIIASLMILGSASFPLRKPDMATEWKLLVALSLTAVLVFLWTRKN